MQWSASSIKQAFGWIGKSRGLQTEPGDWQHFCHASDGKTFSVDFFACMGESRFLRFIAETRGMAGEEILDFDVNAIHPNSVGIAKNLRWLIALAVDFLNDGRPAFTAVTYNR